MHVCVCVRDTCTRYHTRTYTQIHTYTRARGIQFAASFCKTASVHVQGSDSRTTWRNYATNWSPPASPSSLTVPRSVLRPSPPPGPSSPSASSIVSLTLKPLKRSHSRPCSLHRAAGSNHVRLRNASPQDAYIVTPLISQPRSPLSLGCRGRLPDDESSRDRRIRVQRQSAKFNERTHFTRETRGSKMKKTDCGKIRK